ncbi:cell division protein ZapE [Pseudoalteromonas sp. JBTF-M23]|uniref:Cell division protein ZapE n=1 Tax=Pseudoalteromonas caenipelagi TaxID=2726988 RepID=A0A849VF57_9GAMM|nr:cell division protein ZapE [Pseudoalteromonas caenipelagi]NOU50367.1 cell division protein ZapE [Pseudoalteromonas caenipelagi]
MREQYQQLLRSGELSFDSKQEYAVEILERLHQQLIDGLPSCGVYLYGPVGRGKTMLMDMFFNSLEGVSKQRLHFHHFMKKVHNQLNCIQGQSNPLAHIAAQWALHAKVLCFDEFFVTDIGDAIIMARLFDALFAHGVVLVATSNCHPSELYKNGLQRDRFLPTIDLLETHCKVVSVNGDTDHRFTKGLISNHYFVNEPTAFFNAFAQQGGEQISSSIELFNRKINILGQGKSVIAFDFMSLCSAPRATADYIELAKDYPALFIANIPKMGERIEHNHAVQGIEDGYQRSGSVHDSYHLDDHARRFIALVDECYEQRCIVVISSPVDINDLYVGKRLAFEFERTKSRLVEMQHWSF